MANRENTIYSFPHESYYMYFEYFKHIFDWHHGSKIPLDCSINTKINKIHCMIVPTSGYHGKKEINIYLLTRKDCDEFFRSNDYVELENVELLGATKLKIGNSDTEWEYRDDVYQLYDKNSNNLGCRYDKNILYLTFKNNNDEKCKASYEYTKKDSISYNMKE
ncbi:hypothetical protein PIROE2DRAFT_4404 [Piromyces sp. E2]|nr:hypothetical protein PIROE2DRAFT_4404 [Piromyces sp. E2]|eukprot:OUM67987.1 hypothetical protein PIROE2DRAFT_4404 [Piromyces sp. E2]